MSLSWTGAVGLLLLNIVWLDPAVVLGWKRKTSIYKSCQRRVTSLFSWYRPLQSHCGRVAGSWSVQTVTALTQSRGTGDTLGVVTHPCVAGFTAVVAGMYFTTFQRLPVISLRGKTTWARARQPDRDLQKNNSSPLASTKRAQSAPLAGKSPSSVAVG